MNKLVYIETLGCQMNKSDTEKILGILESIGYQETKIPKEAGLLIINTCNIRASAENKAYSHFGVWKKWKKNNPGLKIAMCGCIAQQTKEEIFKRAPYIDLIFGTHNISELPELINRLNSQDKVCSVRKTPYETDFPEIKAKRKNGISAWLPVIEGCDYFCTYCVVPYTRGRQRSKRSEAVINEAKELANQGYKEIILLGQTVDSYGRDFDDNNITLSYLLREINKLENICRIRFTTSHPADITDELIDTVKELDKVCEYFHIPMQSGSTEILEKMKRKYTREEYLNLIEKIKNEIPDVAITSDFIVGFPTETQSQFEETMSIIDLIAFDYCNTALYSPRKQTPAAVWKDQIPQEIKKQRLYILNDKVKEFVKKSNEKCLGRNLEVLAETFEEKNGEIILSGKTRTDKIVHFPGDKSLIGTLAQVNITESSAWCLKGVLY